MLFVPCIAVVGDSQASSCGHVPLSKTPVQRDACPTDSAGHSFGSIYGNAIPIRVVAVVLKQILDYSEQDLRRERGGFLLGTYQQKPLPAVTLQQFLPASQTRAKATSLRFTHDTWSNLTREVDRQFPGSQIIGWHHTHPQMGVFLSSQDIFIHRHFFSQPWQIAMVVDPVAHQFGFFQWWGERVASCGFVCI